MKECKLKPGDKVRMNNRYHVSIENRGRIFTIVSEPYDVCGTICVKLDGYKGCYAADGLKKVN